MKRKIFSILFALVLVLSFSLIPTVVSANPDEWYVDPTGTDDGTHGKSPGSDAFKTITYAVSQAGTGDTINVAAGTYNPFTVDTKTDLTIQSDGAVTVEGAQSVTTAYNNRDCVVFVKNSTNIVLEGLDIQGDGLGLETKDYGVIYENSSGEINDCTVSPNTIGDMNSIAIGIWDSSEVTVDTCILENFGRVGILIYNGSTVEVLDSTIEGQVYSGVNDVCYGIEVEGAYMDAMPETASHVTITGNEIYNCDNPSSDPGWESAAILINGWLEHMDAADSTVIMENNDIHDNYIGIYAVKSPSSHAHCNNIYDNRIYGVISAPLLWTLEDTTAVFDAENNWWGATDGPSLSPGSGDKVSDYVDYDPWLDSPFQESGGAVSMTAASEEAFIGISVSPTFIDFGDITSGAVVVGDALTVKNTGNVRIMVDAEITADTYFNPANTDFFYTYALRLAGCPSDRMRLSGGPDPTVLGKWALMGQDEPFGPDPFWVNESRPLTTGLECPPVIKAATTYTGTVVFWAEQP